MKRVVSMFFAVLLLAAFAAAQDNLDKRRNQDEHQLHPSEYTPQDQKQEPKDKKNGQQQQQPQFTGGTKTNPAPKTKEEATAYVALMQQTDPAALENAANDFATKFPDSQLKGIVYQRSMLMYEQAGNYDKVVENGRKALSFDPEDPVTLAEMANTLASRTKSSDLDKDERYADATKYANSALQFADEVRVDSKAPPAAVEGLKNEVRSQAYTALGTVEFNKKNFAIAETNFAKAVQIAGAQPDPSALLRLGITQRNQSKYAEASQTFAKCIEVSKAQQQESLAQMAQEQKDEADKLAAAKK